MQAGLLLGPQLPHKCPKHTREAVNVTLRALDHCRRTAAGAWRPRQWQRRTGRADVAVAKRVEAMLKHEGLNLKGSSDTQAWASPSEFWRDSSYRLCGIPVSVHPTILQ